MESYIIYSQTYKNKGSIHNISIFLKNKRCLLTLCVKLNMFDSACNLINFAICEAEVVWYMHKFTVRKMNHNSNKYRR